MQTQKQLKQKSVQSVLSMFALANLSRLFSKWANLVQTSRDAWKMRNEESRLDLHLHPDSEPCLLQPFQPIGSPLPSSLEMLPADMASVIVFPLQSPDVNLDSTHLPRIEAPQLRVHFNIWQGLGPTLQKEEPVKASSTRKPTSKRPSVTSPRKAHHPGTPRKPAGHINK